ncbi:MAG TPA: DUF3866 family protein [Acidimicrobiales bacterium]|nr:DUF3866 family protein [Acidimicrobiales bacterium]
MPQFRTGVVTAVLVEEPELQRVEVDGELAYVLTGLTGTVAVGDRVVVNVTAVELGLGTGGWHVVHWNLERDGLDARGGGHIMKMRYTSAQADTGVAEEHHSIPSQVRAGTPIVAIALHSQLAPVAAAVKSLNAGLRVVYVMTDGGALPLAMSFLVADLRRVGLVDGTVTAGHAFGGDEEAVNPRSGFCVASDRLAADVIVTGMGPGSVGTGSRLGFSGLEVADLINGAADVGGRAVIALRYSEADSRERHRGVSHHSTTALGFVRAPVTVPVPEGEDAPGGLPLRAEVVHTEVPDVDSVLRERDLHVTSMGRGSVDDPKFFEYAAAAGAYAAQVASRDA